ncbi:MAG: type II secretion system protein [Candidatus Omnitrophica bacterium]|nr:type II secretion system protein [Candidatus Omnitrophota bacterium]
MKLKPKAFTLIEVLLVSSLIAILGIAIFRSFGNGLKLWAKAQRLNRDADVNIFLDKVAEDLRSTTIVSGLAFKGSETKLSFPAIVMTQADIKSSRASEEIIDQIGAVQYRFEPSEHVIYRRQANYAQAVKGKWGQEEKVVVSGIEDLDIHYEVSSSKGFLLKSEISDGIPSGIVIEVRFSDDSGVHQFKRYLSIPVGG